MRFNELLHTRRLIRLVAISLILGLFASSGAFLPVAHADGSVVQTNEMRYRLFVGNERINVLGNAFWIRAVEQAWLLDYRAQHPQATQEQLVEQLARYDRQLRARGLYDGLERPVYQVVTGALQVLVDSGIPIGSGVSSAVNLMLQALWGENLNDRISVTNQVAGSWQTYGHIREINAVIDLILQRVIATADGDRAFGNARDAFFGDLSRASVYNTAEQFLADPVLATWINTDAIIALLQGDLGHDDIMKLVSEQFTHLSQKIDELRTTQINALIQGNATYQVSETGPRSNAESYATAVLQARQNTQMLETARSGVFIISTLAGFADPTVGNAIARIGNAALDVASAINQYLPTVIGLGIGQALFSASTVALTGNLLGAVMTLLPLFVDPQPTPEQLMMERIMEELGRLRADLGRLGENMNERFDRVERGLSTIYNDMMVEFDRVYELFGDIDDHLGEIDLYLRQMAATLTRLQSRLDEIGQRLQGALDAIHQRELKEEVNYALGFEERYNRPLPDEMFIRAENRFQFYATAVARDDASTAPVQQLGRVNNVDIDPNLADGELVRNLGYLSWLAGYRFGYAIQPRNLPNPAVWSLAARAYARLMAENSVIAATITPQPGVRATGAELNVLTREISQPAADGVTNALLMQLIENYRSAVKEVSNRLGAERAKSPVGRAVDLFGHAHQATSAPDTPSTIQACDNTDSIKLSTPRNAALSELPSEIYTAFAGYRGGPGVPQLRSCYFMETRETDAGSVSVDVTLQTQFRLAESDPWLVVRSAEAENVWSGEACPAGAVETGGEDGLDGSEYRPLPRSVHCIDGERRVVMQWDSTFRSRVEAAAVTVHEAVVSGVASTVTGYLRGEAQRYLHGVSDQLTQDATPLRNAVTAMTGAATLLRAYVRVGFPMALDADDLMSAMLVGKKSIISDSVGSPMVSATYQRAASRFQPCDSSHTVGCTPKDHLYQVLWQQPYLTDGVGAPADIILPGEPVGDALVSSAIARLNVLTERISEHSRRIAAGQHTESLPIHEEVASRLGLAESLVRLGPPTLAVSDVSVTEGDSEPKALTFTITRSGTIADTSSLKWNTANGGATAGSDYVAVAVPQMVSFQRGEISKFVSVGINGDTAVEGDETFSVKLSSPSAGTTIADDRGVGTIINDDVTLAVNDALVTEGNADTKLATFTITRTGDLDDSSSVQWATGNGTALASSDYVGVPLSTVSFTSGEATRTVAVTINGDTFFESDETFSVGLFSSTGTRVLATGTGVISNDDTSGSGPISYDT